MEVLVSDKNSPSYEANRQYFAGIDDWAKAHCATYKGYHVQDVSDVSMIFDEIAGYYFDDEKDAMWFRLKWL